MKIPNTSNLTSLYSPSTVRRVQAPKGEASFQTKMESTPVQKRLTDAIQHIDDSQRVADLKLERLASGEDVDIHGTMIALQEADVTLRFAVSIRDKLLEGYQKIINMSI
ncbi:MAG: flagellar hook-basal body complex protein FliE [Deltaproteobacteria bacterium]|nr:flagellar hook-basal body complex protein FliE [Deltaproteobacteria bacterium]